MAENNETTVETSSEATGKKSFSEIFHSVTSSAPVTALKGVVSKVWGVMKDLGGKVKVKIHEWTAPKEEQTEAAPTEPSNPSDSTTPRDSAFPEFDDDAGKYAGVDELER